MLVYRVAPDREPERLATFERAGVPTVARRDNGSLIAAHQHFPEDDDANFDRVAVRFSSDEGKTWTAPQVIQVEGLPPRMRFPFDPTLVPLPDGGVRLYFTGNVGRPLRRSTPAIHSAISKDGVHYIYESGVRFGIEGRVVIDCAAALHEGVIHLIVPDNGTTEDFARPLSPTEGEGQGEGARQGPTAPPRREPPGGNGYHALSRDGLNFERVADVKWPSSRNRWLGNLASDAGRLVFFGSGPGPWPVTSADGTAWQPAEPATRIPGADPGAVRLRDGSWLLLVTGEPRPGTPSARQRGSGRGQPPEDRRRPSGAPPFQNLGDSSPPPANSPPEREFEAMLLRPRPPGGGSSPREHQVLSATSSDGLIWTRDEGVRWSSASVPCAINDRDQRVLLYAVRPPDEPDDIGGVSCATSTDSIHFTRATDFRIEGLSTRTAADPSILQDREGNFRLYYLASNHRGDPAAGANPHRINFALSEDGLRFREAGTAFTYDDLVDPDVFRYKDRWFMYVFAGRATVIATSVNGRDFQYLRDMTPRDWGTTAAVPLPDGRLRLYAFEQRVPIGNAVHSFLSTDGLDWIAEPGERLRARPDEQITDPFVIPWRGGWKMYFKTSPARPPTQRIEPDATEPPWWRRGGDSAGPPSQVRRERNLAGMTTAGGGGPRNHRILLAASKDGLNWTITNESLAEQASVPELFEGPDGRLIVLFVDASGQSPRGALGAMIRADDGTWTRAQTNLRGADPNVVRLQEGTYRAYTKEADGTIVVSSSRDGLRWEPRGIAFRSDRYRQATDSDVFETPDGWVMLISLGPRLLRCTSLDGLTFTTDGTILDLGGSVSDTLAVPGGWRTYFHVNASPRTGGKMLIRSGFTADGRTWKVEDGDRVAAPARGLAQLGVADPAPVRLSDGTWLMALKSFREAPVQNADWPIPGEKQSPADRFEPPRRDSEPAATPPAGAPPPLRGEPSGAGRGIRVERVESNYRTAPGAKPGFFITGQDADLMLGGFGFNQSGGALVFNHPTGLATDGKTLLMTDRWNNRVLIWKSAPATNTPPDLVLGQPDFTQNDPGTGRHQMNWPGNLAITPEGQQLAVSDTSNDRILIWTSFPTRNGQPADLVLDLAQLSGGPPTPPRAEGARRDGESDRGARSLESPPRDGTPRPASPEVIAGRPRFGGGMRLGWPWGVWTDGKKLAVVATHGGAVLIWNSLPTHDNQPPDFVLRPEGAGTPRNVTSDGQAFFAVSDHNYGNNSRPATVVWNSFPTSATQPPDWAWREWLKGSFLPNGRLALAGIQSIYLFNQPPRSAETEPEVVLRPPAYRNGDGPDAVVAHGRFYVCNYNGNNLLAWNAPPTRGDQRPDFSLGSHSPDQDTWAEHYFIQNPVVATDGRSLFVSSDFDRKMFVWRKLPEESAAKPDLVFHLPQGPWDNELHGSTLALAGRSTVYLWRRLPLNGEPPDAVLNRRMGSIELGELTGVAFDDRYFYLADRRSESIYVWKGIPSQESEPKFTLVMRSPGRLTSDGHYLCAAPFEGSGIQLWRVSELSSRAEPITLGGRGQFNLPSECLIADGRLFVCNRSFNRVDVWNRVEDALVGRPADALLGATDERDRMPAVGRNQLFMPGSLAWGGGYLWVGEFKFSTRILRFSPQPGETTTSR